MSDLADDVKPQLRPLPAALAGMPLLHGEYIAADEDVKIITILNPFNPQELTRTPMAWRENLKVADVMPAALAHAEYVVSVNGQVIEENEYASTTLKPADHVVICPVPQGGGNTGKTILRIVILVIIYYYAPYLAGYLQAGVWGATATGFTGALLTAGIAMAGSMLVNSLIPLNPETPGQSNNKSTQTYGIDGPKNASEEGIPVPVCYGTHRMAGNIVDLYVENVDQTQMLYALVNAGEGPVMNISDLELNDQPIASFENVEWVTRLGTADQALIDWFQDAFTAINLGIKLPVDQSFFNYTTSGFCDKLRFDFLCPNGMFKADKKDGSINQHSVQLQIQYRKLGGDGIWHDLSDLSEPSPDGDVVTTPGSYIDVDPRDGAGSLNAGSPRDYPFDTLPEIQQYLYPTQTTITDASRSAVRRSYTTPKLEFARYETRIKRLSNEATDDYTSDKVYISDINLITSAKVAYNHTALVGVKIKLTDQLNGLPNITYINHGRIIRVWDRVTKDWTYTNSSNPAWIVYDMLTNWRYGGQVDDGRINIERFKEWAKFCDDNALEFNGVFDSKLTLWDAMQFVCRLGHAQLLNIGTRWSIAIEGPDVPVMMFGVGNIKKGSFKTNWLPMTERANECSVTFFDSTNHYKPKTIKVYDPVILTQGRPQRSAELQLIGVTDEMTAVREAVLQLNLNRYILQTIEFEAPVEALACTVGSLVYVQHDMPNWEQSGRLAAGSTNAVIQLDRPVDMVTGTAYKFFTMYPSAAVGTAGTVTAVDTANGYLMLSQALPPSFKRINVGGRDRECQLGSSSTGSVVWVDDLSGISAGAAYQLYDTDLIAEADVVNPGTGSYSSITLTAPLALGAPTEFQVFMFGPLARVKRPYRVKTMSAGTDMLERHLTLVQYDERVYDLDTSNYNGPSGPTTPGSSPFELSNVQALSVWEEVFIAGAQVKNRVVLAWSPPQYGIFKGVDVWIAPINDQGALGEPLKKVGDVVGSNRLAMDLDVGKKYRFKVVAYDMFDQRVNFDAAPTIDYKVTGIATTPPVPRQPSGLLQHWAGKDCRIFWRYNSQNNSYEIGTEPYGGDSGFVDPAVLDYEVKVYQNTNDGTPSSPLWKFVRTEYVANPWFTYTWEMNSQDGLKRHLKFEVRVRMKIGPPSLAATIEAYNDPILTPSFSIKNIEYNAADVAYVKPTATDFEGVVVYMSTVSGFTYGPTNLVYEGSDTLVHLAKLNWDTDYYVRIGAYDTFGKTGMVVSGEQHFKTPMFDVNAIAHGVLGIDLLDDTLRARIDLVDGDMPGSVNARILGEATARGAAILTETTLRQSAIDSLASRVDSVYASLAGVGSAAVQEGVLAQLTANGGVASMYDALSTVVAGNHAAFLSQVTVQAGINTSNASSITTLTSTVNLKNRTFYQAAAPTSTSGYTLVTNDRWIDTDDSNKAYVWSGSAWTYVENPEALKNRTFAQTSAPTSTSSYTLKTGDLWVDSDGNNALYRWDGASWALVQDLNIAANTVALSVQQSVTNGLSAQYVVKIDNNGYVAGFGLASSAVSSVDNAGRPYWSFASTFEVLADSFQVRLPGYPTVIPFSVGNVDGTPKVLITSAMIGDAAIGTLKIGSEAVIAPRAATGTYGTISGTDATVCSVSYTTPSDASQVPSALFVWGGVYFQNSGGSSSSGIAKIKRNGTTIAEFGCSMVGGFSDSVPVVAVDGGLATSTTYTYTIEVNNGGFGGATVTIPSAAIALIAAKR
jgi:predicted phage tail protein